jgi:hypothetical protein
MARRGSWTLLALAIWSLFALESASAQPARQMPALGQFLKQTPPPPPANQRVRPAANQIGFTSTDFYPKQGYPRFLGDAVDAAQGTGQSGMTGASGQMGQTGQTGQFGGGFQGNIGNQIGQNSGGTIFGGLFGGGGGGAGGGGMAGGGLLPGRSAGISGGGFTGGMVMKGFGFGGTPDLSSSSNAPLHGFSSR